jgi:hypothetical protein
MTLFNYFNLLIFILLKEALQFIFLLHDTAKQ